MKLGIETAFNRINDGGGVDGRMLKLFAADDGYEPGRTLDAMKQLYEKDQVFGIIGNVGTPTVGSGDSLCARTPDAVLRGLHRLQHPAQRSAGSLRLQLSRQLCSGNRRGRSLPRQDTPAAAAPDRGLRAAGFVRRFRICRGREGVPLHGRERQRHPSAQLCAQHRRRGRRDQPVEAREAADQGDGHGRDLPGRGKVHREDARSPIPG